MDDHASELLNVRDVVAVIRRQMRLIVATTIAVVLCAAAVAQLMAPTYRASVLMLVDASRKDLLDTSRPTPVASYENARVESEVAILASDRVLWDTARALRLETDPEFSGSRTVLSRWVEVETPPESAADDEIRLAAISDRLRKAITVQRRGGTNVIEVSAQSTSPEKAARLVNHLAQAYINIQVAEKVAQVASAKALVERQVETARQLVESSEASLSQYAHHMRTNILASTERFDLRALNTRFDELNAGRIEKATHVVDLSQRLVGADFPDLHGVVKSEVALGFARERLRLEEALSHAAAGSSAETALKKGMLGIEQLLLSAARSELTEAEAALAALDAETESARQDLNAAIASVALAPEAHAQIYGLQQAARLAAEKYQALLSRLQDFDAELSLQVADSRVVSPALPPSKPSSASPVLIVGIAAFLGLGAGISMAFLRENYTDGVTSFSQLPSMSRGSLGAILPFHAERPASASIADSLIASGPRPYAQAVARLRGMMDVSFRTLGYPELHRGGSGKVILVTSALAHEGRTSIALSIARNYALTGSRVLILDCDLRNPDLHRQLDFDSGTGLVELLNGSASEADFKCRLRVDPKSPLVVAIGGGASTVPADQLVSSGMMMRLMVAATKRFDYVIVDTPPVERAADGLYLSQHAHVVVFVVRWAKTAREQVADSMNTIAAALRPGAELVPVLNQRDSHLAY